MKKILQTFLLCLAVLLACNANVRAQLLNETFEPIPPATATTIPTQGWIKQIGANVLGTTFNWNPSNNTSLGLTWEAVTFLEGSGAGTFEKWLVTPQLQPNSTNNQLKFKARLSSPTPLSSKLMVRVSTTSQTTHASFTNVATFSEGGAGITDTKTEFTVNLSAYNNQNIYIAFIWEGVAGGNGVYLDDIKDIPFPPKPVMDIRGNGNVITSGTTTTSTTNDTNFGSTLINTTDIEKTFTIQNTGNVNLNLTGTPIIAIGGTDASAFSVTQQATTPIAAATSVTFKIKLIAASTQGIKNATVSITNNSGVSPFTFAIAGTISGPAVSVTGNGNAITNGATTTSTTNNTNFGTALINTTDIEKTFTIQNTGNLGLNLTGNPIIAISGADASAFSVTQQATTPVAAATSVTFKIKLIAASTQGIKNATVSITNNSGVSPFTFAIAGTISPPAPVVTGNGNAITSGTTSTSTTNDTDFGSTLINTTDIEKTFTIQNVGTANLNLTGTPIIAISGTNASAFSVTQQAATPIAATTSVTFKIKLIAASTQGIKNATVSITNNSGVSPFTFAIAGTISGSVVSVTGNGNAITSGTTTTSTTNDTNFGSTLINTTDIEKTFTIQNVGSANLNLTGTPIIAISGTNASAFSVTQQATTPIAATTSVTFKIKLIAASTQGIKNATVSITNSSGVSPFTFAIAGTISGSVVSVTGNGNAITNGATTTSTTNNTNFGTTVNNTTDIEKTFTIQNTGNLDLNLTGNPIIAISGADASAFSVTQQAATPIAAATSVTFKIKLIAASAQGTKNATVSITNNSGVSPFTFAIAGTISPPAPVVTGNGNAITNGTTTTSITNDTNFGSTLINTTDIVKTFTIQNVGTANLNLTGSPIIAITGTGASAFAVTQQAMTPITVNASVTFSIKLIATSTQGFKNATVSITNNSGVSPFTFAIVGEIKGPSISITSNSTSITNGSTTTSTTNNTNFGNVIVNSVSTERTYTIINTGTSDLSLTGSPIITIAGSDASFFTVTQQPVSPIVPNGTTTFKIAFNPTSTSLGAKSAIINLSSNAGGLNIPFTFAISATIVAGEIGITGNANAVANGATTTSATNNTDFGNTNLTFYTDKIFTIQNTGTAILTLTGTPIVSISGTDASRFTVLETVGNTVDMGGNFNFKIRFTPNAPTGTSTAIVTITSNSFNNSTFTFAISGNALPIPVPTINIKGNGNAIANGSTSTSTNDNTNFGTVQAIAASAEKAFTIENTGNATLTLSGSPTVQLSGTNASEFTITQMPTPSIGALSNTSFKIKFIPSSEGAKTATVTINSNSSTNAAYTFAIEGNATAPPIPTIDVQGNNVSITNGSTATSVTNFTEYPNTAIGMNSSRTFVVKNTGTGTLNLLGSPVVVMGGTNASDFMVETPPSTVILPNQSANFTIKFSTMTTGAKTATVTLKSNTNNVINSTFTFTIGATALPTAAPVIAVKGNNVAIANGSTTPTTADHTDFGQTVKPNAIERTFTIENTGTANLSITNVLIGGTNPTYFTISQSPSTTIQPSQSTTFKVRFSTITPNERMAAITIRHNAGADFVFAVKGKGDPALSAEPRLSVGKLNIYPNPARQTLNFNLQGNHAKNIAVELFDLKGKRISAETLSLQAGKGQLNLPKAKAGMYLLRVQVGKEWITEKIVIE